MRHFCRKRTCQFFNRRLRNIYIFSLFFIVQSGFAINIGTAKIETYELDTTKVYKLEESVVQANSKILPRHRLNKEINIIPAVLVDRSPIKSVKELLAQRLSYNYMLQDGGDAEQANPISMYIFNYLRHKLTASLHHKVIRNLNLSWYLRFQDRAGSYQKYTEESAPVRSFLLIV